MPERFVHRLRVRYNECDPQGIVFNANFLTFCDVALTEFMRATIGSYEQMVKDGADLVVIEATLRFHASAKPDELLELAFVPERLGETSMRSRVEIERDGQRLVTGHMAHVFVDPRSLAKRSIPEPVRGAFTPYLAPAEAPA